MSQQRDPSSIPPPLRNNGWFTGEEFKKDAPWAGVPMIPATAWLNHVNLRSANPPIQALFQQGANHRPGNNSTDLYEPTIPGVARFVGDKGYGPFSGISCMPCLKKTECSCGYDCPCKEKCADNAVNQCPCKSVDGCPIRYIPID